MNYDQDHRLIDTIAQLITTEIRTILEIGCGDGNLSVLLARHAANYVAIDPNGAAIRQAQSLASQVDFRIGTGEALEFADASFSVVLFVLSLHHQNSRIALEEAHRVLAKGGQLIVLEPSAQGELQQFFHLFEDESRALADAAMALEQSPFHLIAHHMVEVMAEFDDPEALCQYPFERAVVAATDRTRILEKLRQLRGCFRGDQAIHLVDTIHLYSLRKAPPQDQSSANALR